MLFRSMAHSMQIRNNFKDVAVQYYGMQPDLEAIRTHINDVFNSLPAPRASLAVGLHSGLTTMVSYNSASNGCFAGSSIVFVTKDPFTDIPYPKRMSELQRGDFIATSSKLEKLQNYAQVTHIAIMHNSEPFPVVKFPSGLIITPWHPVKHEGVWQFPAEILLKDPSAGEYIEYDEEIYNIALDGADYAEINGTTVITLGHQITENPVAAHPYFGSQRILDDLDEFDMDEWGRVHLTPDNVQRDQETHNIVRYVCN